MPNEIVGLRELAIKLDRLGIAISKKALMQSASAAVTQIVRELKAAAPVGSKEHKTYKGRLVAPGFLSRSIHKKSRFYKRRGAAVVSIGVSREAFYGVSFLEGGTKKIKAQPWLESTFIRNRKNIENRLSDELKKRIKRAIVSKK